MKEPNELSTRNAAAICLHSLVTFFDVFFDKMTSNKSLLTELKYFVNGVPNLHRGLPPDVSSQLVKCSLTLLEELSTSREVILEYFSMVFDESVKNYVAYEVILLMVY